MHYPEKRENSREKEKKGIKKKEKKKNDLFFFFFSNSQKITINWPSANNPNTGTSARNRHG
jgi:hypothetical protein